MLDRWDNYSPQWYAFGHNVIRAEQLVEGVLFDHAPKELRTGSEDLLNPGQLKKVIDRINNPNLPELLLIRDYLMSEHSRSLLDVNCGTGISSSATYLERALRRVVCGCRSKPKTSQNRE